MLGGDDKDRGMDLVESDRKLAGRCQAVAAAAADGLA